MMKRHSAKIFTAVAVVATLVLASYALADWGRGWGHMGYGPHHRGMMGYYGDYGPDRGGYGPRGDFPAYDMSREQAEQIEKQREAFFTETEPLRERLYEKQTALRSELTRENPDMGKASELQKEISELQGQFDQKRLEHQMEMRKILPDTGRGFASRGMGPRGYGGGYGYGPGACWR